MNESALNGFLSLRTKDATHLASIALGALPQQKFGDDRLRKAFMECFNDDKFLEQVVTGDCMIASGDSVITDQDKNHSPDCSQIIIMRCDCLCACMPC